MQQTFDSAGIEIAFIDEGAGAPVLLVHGFASNHRVNWVSTSWTRDLVGAGRRVIAFDNRGHGESGKPHDPAAYAVSSMAEDARRLLDHLGIVQADAVGYSLGARIVAELALRHPNRVRSAVLGGVGEKLLRHAPFDPPEPLVFGLRAASLDEIADPRSRAYRIFADQTRSDREALAACILGARDRLTADDLASIRVPVLVATGSEDRDQGTAAGLAAAIPGAEAFEIPGRDHMKAVGDKAHKAAVIDFLARQDVRTGS